MSDGDGEIPRAFIPLLVVRLRKRLRSIEEINRHSSASAQWVAIERYAEDKGLSLASRCFVVRMKGRRYTLERDSSLKKAVAKAIEDRHVLLMDDVFRLIAGMEEEPAVAMLTDLLKAKAPIYSILHGNMLTRLPRETIKSNLTLHVGRLRGHSRRIKQGLAIYGGNLAPSRKAIKRGAQSRIRTADRRAQALHQEIEKIRAELSENERSNRAAIARALNAAGIQGPGGGAWQGTTVKRIEERVAKFSSGD